MPGPQRPARAGVRVECGRAKSTQDLPASPNECGTARSRRSTGNPNPDTLPADQLSTAAESFHSATIPAAGSGSALQGRDMALPHVTAAGSLALGLALGLLPMSPAAAAADATPSPDWRWPLAGTPVVARPFQPPPHPWSAGHRGVDLAAVPGATVLAAGGGVVSFAGYVAGVGVVAIRHPDGLRTTYEPVSPGVRAGAVVSAGDPIGRLLPGHGQCGPARWCLHWGLLRGAVYLDPLSLIHRGPVRLLPLDGESVLAPTAAAAGMPSPVVRRHPDRRAAQPARGHRLLRDTVVVGGTAATLGTALGWWPRRRGRRWQPQRWRLRWAAG